MESKENELIKSPLQQLEFQTAQAKASSNNNSPNPNSSGTMINSEPTSPTPNVGERDSIYSFDSVSTNGRLLDRLGLENEDLFDNDDANSRFERLSISDINGRNQPYQPQPYQLQNPYKYATNKPITADQSQTQLNIERFPSYKTKNIFNLNPNLQRHKSQNSKDPNQMFSVKNVPTNIAYPNRTKSIDSFQADINSITPKSSIRPEVSDQVELDRQKSVKLYEFHLHNNNNSDEYDEFNFNTSSSDSVDEKPLQYSKSQKLKSSGDILKPSPDPITRNRSVSSYTSSTKPPHSPIPRRTVSDYTTASSPNGKSVEMNPEARTKLSLQLRGLGKHREASYQLQIAANHPYNDLKAMYMYAMALKFGQGVKQNDKTSLKWLSKCMLANSGDEAYTNTLNDLPLENLLKLIMIRLKNDTTEIDPFNLYDYYSKMPTNQISKIINTCKSQSDVTLLVYHEFGNYLINGWGAERDELMGMKALGIASSMGNFNSMIALGELWCSKSKVRKKDNHKASAWYRLSEVFGVKSIGNSWIYKEKYLQRK